MPIWLIVAPIISEVVGEAAVEITRTANEAGESALGNLIADGMRDATAADFAFMNSGGIRDNLKKGPITWGELFAIQPFGNDIVTLNLTGEQVRTLLNQQFCSRRKSDHGDFRIEIYLVVRNTTW